MALRMVKLENAITHVQPECQDVVMELKILEKYVMMALETIILAIVIQPVLTAKCQYVVMVQENSMMIRHEVHPHSAIIVFFQVVLNSVMKGYLMEKRIVASQTYAMQDVEVLQRMNLQVLFGLICEPQVPPHVVIVQKNDRSNVMRVLRLMVLLVIALVLVQPMHQPVVMVSKMLVSSVMMDPLMILDLVNVHDRALEYGVACLVVIHTEIKSLQNSQNPLLDSVVESILRREGLLL